MTFLLETTNSFGRQHHLNTLRSETIPCAAPHGDTHDTEHVFSPAPCNLPQHGTENVSTGTAQCTGMSACWYDAEACSRCDQGAASPACSSQSASDRWHDAVSDVASSTCSCSVPDCSAILQEDRKRSLRESLGSACSLDTATPSSAWQQCLEEDTQQWQTAEWAAVQQESQARRDATEAVRQEQLEASRQRTEQARQRADQAQQQAHSAMAAAAAASEAAASAVAEAKATAEAQVAAARLVSSVFGRVLGRAQAEEEVALLQKRVEQLRGITSAMGMRPWPQAADEHSSVQRQLVNAGMAVGCAALGLAGAYLITRRHR